MEQLTEQFIGVLFVHSFDVSSKMVRRTISDSRWLGHIHRGSNKSRFEYCTNSNNNLLYARAIQGRSGGELIAVAIPLRWKEFLYHVGRSFTVNSIRQAGLIAAADGILHTLRPLWCWNRRGIRWFIEAKKSTLQEQMAGFSGRSPLGQFGKSTRKHGLTPLSSLIRCWLHRKNVVSLPGDHGRLRRSCRRPPGRWSKANYPAARNRVRRETSSKLISVFKEFHTAVLEDQGRDLDSRLGEHAENGIPNRICQCRLEQDTRIQRIQWGIQKDSSTLGKDRIDWIGRSLQENTVFIMRRVLARRTVILHLRNRLSAFNGAEAQ